MTSPGGTDRTPPASVTVQVRYRGYGAAEAASTYLARVRWWDTEGKRRSRSETFTDEPDRWPLGRGLDPKRSNARDWNLTGPPRPSPSTATPT